MVKYCMAPGCHNSQNNKKIHFHRLPLNRPSHLKKWLIKMKLKNPAVNKYSVICSAHFTSDCYVRDFRSDLLGCKRKFILKEAVPTVFDFSNYKKVSDVPSVSKSFNVAKNSSRRERLQRRSWNQEVQKVCDSID